jgi:hypothetical protein
VRVWDATSGENFRIHAGHGVGVWSWHAVWIPKENRIIEASGEVWRWLGWIDGNGGRLPLETFGPVPYPARLNKLISG